MRLPATRPLRVWPGDEVVVRASLPSAARLGRLYVFAREGGEEDFSPYVPGLARLAVGDEPRMMSPLSLRLVEQSPSRVSTFTSDIDGHVCVMQEVDSKSDALARVRLRRRINPELPWATRLARTVTEMFAVSEPEALVIMLVASGRGDDTQWFDYRPGFYRETVRVEWEIGTMSVAIPRDVADYLTRNGYARAMTEREVEEYTQPPPPPPEKAEVEVAAPPEQRQRRPKKGE